MGKVLRMSEAASLALHAMAYLAANSGARTTAKQIAEEFDASQAHLHKVLQRLTKAGFVESVPGPGGGFTLKNGAERMSLLDVYEAIEGPMVRSTCLFGHSMCQAKNCILGGLVERISDQTRDYLAETRLSDLSHVFRSDDNGS